MHDFENYIQDAGRPSNSGAVLLEIDDIEHDLSAEISSILKDRAGSLFLTDRFKCGRHCIDIIYPSLYYPGNRSLIEHPDRVRFLLSLYPAAGKLGNIDRIILKPRHVELSGVELMALYIRGERILVMYLHRPYLHPVAGGSIEDYSFIPFFISRYASGGGLWSGCLDSGGCVSSIPALWHILSVISFAPDGRTDKFFLACADDGSAAISESLENISSFYARRGY